MIPVFSMARGGDVAIDVALPAEWAAAHDRIEVVFDHAASLGWHARIESPDGERVMSFSYADDVDQMLRGDRPFSLMPDPALPGGEWDDLDQGWWGHVVVVDGCVYLAETVLDDLIDIPGAPALTLTRPGRVDASGVPIRWHRVPRPAWDAAWANARAVCRVGAPAPSRPPRRDDG